MQSSVENRLSRDAVIDAALALADRDGLEAVSMRAVAAHLGTAPMSLYRHVRNKSQLLDLMFARIVDGLASMRPAPTWQAELDALSRNARRALLAHPSWIPLLTRHAVPMGAVATYEHLVRRMRSDGIPTKTAFDILGSVVAVTLGSVLVELMMRGSDVSVPLRQLKLAREAIASGGSLRSRRVAAAAARYVDKWSFDRTFEIELGSILTAATRAA